MPGLPRPFPAHILARRIGSRSVFAPRCGTLPLVFPDRCRARPLRDTRCSIAGGHIDPLLTVQCRQCGHQHEIASIPARCPYCGTLHQMPKPVKTEAEVSADALAAKFKLAASRAKGDF